jgi:hypothetical protein
MPHLGKAIPRQWINFILNPFHTRSSCGPTRKLRFTFFGGARGTVAQLWQNSVRVSTVAERDSADGIYTFYTWVNPADQLATITLRTVYGRFPPGSTSFNRFGWKHVWSAFYNGTKLADFTVHSDNEGVLWGHTANGIDIGPSWSNLTNTTLWRDLRGRCVGASWADQPEYHPYRH